MMKSILFKSMMVCMFLGLTMAAEAQKVPTVTLPAQDNEALLAQELAERKPGRANRFAEVLDVQISPSTHGEWTTLDMGMELWRVAIVSAGAQSLNFGIIPFYLPEGATLNFTSGITGEIIRPFTHLDNEDHGQLWTPIVDGDMAFIELKVPTAVKEDVSLTIAKVGHDFIGFGSPLAASGSCNLDVICGAADGWPEVDPHRDIIQSVGVYSYGGGLVCTGALINNTANDCKPLFLTAAHCGGSTGNAASLVGYWNFESPDCRQPFSAASGGNGNGSLAQFTTGATFRAGYTPSDMVLFEFDDPIAPEAEPYFAGWSREDVIFQTAIAIHHPNLDEKRISFENDPGEFDSWFGTPNTHHRVNDWDTGTTEPGSSGSPLFDQNERIIGQLHGGSAACSNDLEDLYGRVTVSWTGGGTPATRLSDWLDPLGTGAEFIDGKNCSYALTALPGFTAMCAGESLTVDFQAGEAFAGMVDLSVLETPPGVTVAIADLSVNPGGSTEVTISAGGGVATGTYSITIEGTDGTNTGTGSLIVNISGGLPANNVLETPANNATEIGTLPQLIWDAEQFTSYELQLASDAAFTDIIAQGSDLLTGNFPITNQLEIGTEYFWRVRGSNNCGQGEWADTFVFTTSETFSCSTTASGDIPVEISNGAPALYTSTVEILESVTITDIDVLDLSGAHTYLGDLSFSLTSPSGTTILLIPFSCGNTDSNILLSLDDQASSNTIPCPYNDGDSYQPAEPLSTFNGEDSQGTWTLTVEDDANADGGSLDNWTLFICGNPTSVTEQQAIEATIFPNPTQGELNLRLSQSLSEQVDLRILDMQGKAVYSRLLKRGEQSVQFSVEELPAGVYMLQLSGESLVVNQRLIIK